jgi:pimeloyl-ACP methyl ester carboxylesterase
MTPFEDLARQTVDLPQGTVEYRATGTGPTIVLLHGLLVDGALWRDVVPRLEPDFHLVVPELPLGCHRLPMRADADLTPPGVAKLVADFLDALDLDEVTLVGNDTGGAISQMVAAHHPERIGRLVLTPCDTYENFLPPMFRPLQWMAYVPPLMTGALQGMRLRRMRLAPNAFGWLMKRPDDALVKSWVAATLANRGARRDAMKLLRGVSKRQTLVAAERLRSFDRPVLLAWAPEDKFFKFSYAERLASDIPTARLERIDDARSFVPIDQPARTAELIAAFAREPQGALHA